jgi:hypothetical protein
MPGARCRARADQNKRYRGPGQNSGAEETMMILQRRLCQSALKACGWKGTAQARENWRRIDQDLPGVFKRRDTPRAHLQGPTESKGGREVRRRSPASMACTCPLLHRGERYLLDGPAPGGCIPAPRNPRRMSMIATRGGAGGGRQREDPALPDREGLASGAAGKNGRDAERRARGTGSRLALAEQFPRGQADPGHRQERRRTLTRRGTLMRARSTSCGLCTPS